jgi:hypothetical protein
MKRLAMNRILSGALIVSLAACGGGSSTPTPPVTTPAQSVRTVLAMVPFDIRAGATTFKSVDNPPIGTLDATLEWGTASSRVDFYATDGRCPGFPDLQAGRCTILARADGTGKPKRLTFTNTTANAVIIFWIHNLGTITESGQMEVAVTTAAGVVVQPTPIPSPSGTPDPRTGWAPGPVTQARIGIRSIDTGGFNYRDPQQDENGNWIVHPGEFVVFDLTQRNGAGEKCQWIKDPEWFVNDEAGVVSLRGSSNLFLLRVDILKRGFVEIEATIDGIDTNVLTVVAAGRS